MNTGFRNEGDDDAVGRTYGHSVRRESLLAVKIRALLEQHQLAFVGHQKGPQPKLHRRRSGEWQQPRRPRVRRHVAVQYTEGRPPFAVDSSKGLRGHAPMFFHLLLPHSAAVTINEKVPWVFRIVREREDHSPATRGSNARHS